VHGGVKRGLVLTPEGRRQALWRDGGWQISERLQPWRGRVSYLAGDGEQLRPGRPNLIFLPNGQTSAFRIQLGGRQCRSDGWTGLACGAG
jgi:hypothetical protein